MIVFHTDRYWHHVVRREIAGGLPTYRTACRLEFGGMRWSSEKGLDLEHAANPAHGEGACDACLEVLRQGRADDEARLAEMEHLAELNSAISRIPADALQPGDVLRITAAGEIPSTGSPDPVGDVRRMIERVKQNVGLPPLEEPLASVVRAGHELDSDGNRVWCTRCGKRAGDLWPEFPQGECASCDGKGVTYREAERLFERVLGLYDKRGDNRGGRMIATVLLNRGVVRQDQDSDTPLRFFLMSDDARDLQIAVRLDRQDAIRLAEQLLAAAKEANPDPISGTPSAERR